MHLFVIVAGQLFEMIYIYIYIHIYIYIYIYIQYIFVQCIDLRCGN